MPGKKISFWSLALLLGAGLLVFWQYITFLPKEIPAEAAELPVKIVPEKREEKPVTLVFVGDIMLSRAVGDIMERQGDWDYPFLLMGDFIREADIAFGNLEGPISGRGEKIGSIYSFKADPRSVQGLVFAGFDVLSLANNHMLDYGTVALEDTIELLRQNNISFSGAGELLDAAVMEASGVKFAFLSYTNFSNNALVAFTDEERIKKDILEAKNIADMVIVSYHFGEEYETKHNNFQERLAHLAADAGANLVIGHHPHVPQDTEKYKDSFIAYSLGNFVFDQNFSADTQKGLVLKVGVENKKITKIEEIGIKFNGRYQPYIPE